MPSRREDDFEIIGKITDVEKIAEGKGVKIRAYLNKRYGKGYWRKLKGTATVLLLFNRKKAVAQLHWFEAHGIGKRKMKIKRVLRYL